MNAACFVQSCLTDADFVLFSNYCLIGTRLFARLYTKNRRDAIILYGILNGQDLFAVNDKLFAENEESLY